MISRSGTLPLAAAVVLPLTMVACGSDDGDSQGKTPPTTEATGTTEAAGTTVVLDGKQGGCAEAFFYATNADDTIAITLSFDLGERTGEIDAAIGVGADAIPVEVQLLDGTDLSTTFCTDVPQGTVDARSEGTGVQGRVEVGAPAGPPEFAQGTIELTELYFDDGRKVGPLTVTTDMIGFYAG